MTKNLNSCIYVKQIPNETTDTEIKAVFAPFGNIISIKLKRKPQARFMHASILFDKVESCQNAIRALHESRPFGNNAINIQFWVSKADLEAEKEE